jgi:hypothetical protein
MEGESHIWSANLIFFTALVTTFGQCEALGANVVVGSIAGSFDVSLSGSSNYSIPIKIAPGTVGTQPQIPMKRMIAE